MQEIHLYAESNKKTPAQLNRRYAYRLEWRRMGRAPVSTGAGGVLLGTYNQAVLHTLIQGLRRLNQSCRVVLHLENTYIANMVETRLNLWAGRDFQNSRGDAIKNEELWRQLWTELKKHTIEVEKEKYSQKTTEKLKELMENA